MMEYTDKCNIAQMLTENAFAMFEAVLYLDTHPDDMEAFKMLKQFMRLSKEARRRYTEKYGPISRKDMLDDSSFTWTKKPWPWQYMGGEK